MGESKAVAIMLEPAKSRCIMCAWSEFVALHQTITERNAQILYRGTQVKSYDDPKALPDRAA